MGGPTLWPCNRGMDSQMKAGSSRNHLGLQSKYNEPSYQLGNSRTLPKFKFPAASQSSPCNRYFQRSYVKYFLLFIQHELHYSDGLYCSYVEVCPYYMKNTHKKRFCSDVEVVHQVGNLLTVSQGKKENVHVP